MFWSQWPVSTSGPTDQFCASKYAGQRVVVVLQDHGSRYGGNTIWRTSLHASFVGP